MGISFSNKGDWFLLRAQTGNPCCSKAGSCEKIASDNPAAAFMVSSFGSGTPGRRILRITEQKRHVAWIPSSRKNKNVVRRKGLKKKSYNEIRVSIRSISNMPVLSNEKAFVL